MAEAETPAVDQIAKSVADKIGEKFLGKDQADGIQKSINDLSARLDRVAASISTKERALDDRYRGYKSLTEFAEDVRDASAGGIGLSSFDEARRERFKTATMVTKGPSNPSGGNLERGPDGGFLLPPAFSDTIIDSVFETADLLGLFPRYTVTGESLTFNQVDETTRTLTSVRGGFFAGRKNEVEQMTGGKAKFRQFTLTPSEMYSFGFASDKLLRNVPAFEQWLVSGLAEALRHRIGWEIFDGTGAGQFLGINSSSALITVAKDASQPNFTITESNLANMRRRLPASSWSRFVVFTNQDTQAQLDLMTRVVKNVAGTENVGGFQVQIYNPDRDTIYGRPIYRPEYCKTLGNRGDIYFIDPTAYWVGVKGTVDSAASMHLRFDYAETAFRTIIEIDAKPLYNVPLTPLNGAPGTTLSHLVTLEARS